MRFPTPCAALLLAALCGSSAQATDFSLSSPDITDGGTMAFAQTANMFGCAGSNVSPQLSWSNAPEGTKSYVVSAYDMDAPTGSGFWHWVMFNIPADVTVLEPGITPTAGAPAGAIQSRADAGFAGYLGACPLDGMAHRYVFTVIALKVEKLDLKSDASGALIGFMANANALAKATITVSYSR